MAEVVWRLGIDKSRWALLVRRTNGCALVAWVAGICVVLPEGLRPVPLCFGIAESLEKALLAEPGTGKSLSLGLGTVSYDAMLDWKSSKLTGGRKLKEPPLVRAFPFALMASPKL